MTMKLLFISPQKMVKLKLITICDNVSNFIGENHSSKLGEEQAIILLLKKEKIDLHLKDKWDRTVLHKITGVALANFCTDEEETDRFINCLKLLLGALGTGTNKNVDLINAKDKWGFTSLHHAIYFGTSTKC